MPMNKYNNIRLGAELSKKMTQALNLSVVLPLFLAIILSGCSVTNKLGENEKLYIGHKINITDKQFTEQWGLKGEIKKTVQPKPNDRLFGFLSLKLWFYNLAGDSVPLSLIHI